MALRVGGGGGGGVGSGVGGGERGVGRGGRVCESSGFWGSRVSFVNLVLNYFK